MAVLERDGCLWENRLESERPATEVDAGQDWEAN